MEKTILPDYVVLQRIVEDNVHTAEQMAVYANNHLKSLKEEGIPTDLETLKPLIESDEAFKAWIDEAERSYIGRMGFLPVEEKRRIHKSFADLTQRTDSARSSLNGFLFNRHSYKVIQAKDGTLSVDLEELRKNLEEKHRKTFTQKDKQYFALIQNVHEAFAELQAFEQKEKYIPFSESPTINSYIRNGVSIEGFANSYEWGKMNKEYLKMMKED